MIVYEEDNCRILHQELAQDFLDPNAAPSVISLASITLDQPTGVP
jgi:hypothetical protein